MKRLLEGTTTVGGLYYTWWQDFLIDNLIRVEDILGEAERKVNDLRCRIDPYA